MGIFVQCAGNKQNFAPQERAQIRIQDLWYFFLA